MWCENRNLISPFIDFLMIGGLSIVVYFLTLLAGGHVDVVWWAWLLAFFVNGPHFLASYRIFYSRGLVFLASGVWPFLAGVVVPVALVVFLSLGVLLGVREVFVYVLYLMIFLVGWHYVKQAYGCFVVYSAGNGVFYSRMELRLIKYSLFPLWWGSLSFFFVSFGDGDYWGVRYNKFLGAEFADVGYWLAMFSMVAVFGTLLWRMFRREKSPGLIAITPLLCVFLWLSPMFFNSIYYYVVPLFHSLQYMLFSGKLSYGRIKREGAGAREFCMWWGCVFILAALYFHFVPNYLDSLSVFSSVSPTIFLAVFLLFVNVHHYFLDSVIWKKGSTDVKENLSFS